MHRILLFVLLSLFSSTAFAQSVGTYTCNECLLTSPAPDGDTLVFIRTVVNHDVDTWWNSSTGQGKRVTICNQSQCVVYQYMANGNFLFVASAPISGDGSGGGGGDDGGYVGGGGGFDGSGYTPIYGCVTAGGVESCQIYYIPAA